MACQRESLLLPELVILPLQSTLRLKPVDGCRCAGIALGDDLADRYCIGPIIARHAA